MGHPYDVLHALPFSPEVWIQIGNILEVGNIPGVPWHPFGALLSYAMAYNKGSVDAAQHLARCYINGIGRERDVVAGIEFLIEFENAKQATTPVLPQENNSSSLRECSSVVLESSDCLDLNHMFLGDQSTSTCYPLIFNRSTTPPSPGSSLGSQSGDSDAFRLN